MTTSDVTPLRIVQSTTGNVARQTGRAVMGRPDRELVGVYAHSASKVGCDVAELCGLPDPTGILATNNAIPAVCTADTGIRSYADLPTVSTRLTLSPPP